MGISMLTALMIQNPDNDIRCLAGGPVGGKWTGWISLYRDGQLHSDLLSTQPVYASKSKAVGAMKKLVEDIRSAKLDQPSGEDRKV